MKNPLFLMRGFSVALLALIIFGVEPISVFSVLANNFRDSEFSFAQPSKNLVKTNSEAGITQSNSILKVLSVFSPNAQTLGVLDSEEGITQRGKGEIVEYTIEKGDTLASISSQFEISLNTVLWANNLSKSSAIKPGQKLIIPPVNGVLYYIKKGDTLSSIAKTYKGDTSKIVAFNELTDEGDIFIGDILMIPDGVKPTVSKPASIANIPIGSSYFICPNSSCKITQGLHWYNAVDFGGQCGDFIYAAAAGVVQKIKYGWNSGGGNYITILHPNGVVTYYGHIAAALTSVGQEVSQGTAVALMGGKPGTTGAGISTGCHVHFDVRGSVNPFAK